MFSLIKKGIHALKPESCSLCPYGDGTHPPAKIRWDILDKGGKPLLSKKRAASGSLLMLPDQAETDRIGGPREEILPAMFCGIRPFTELPGIALEAPVSEPPALASPVGEAVRFESGTFEPSNRFSWRAIEDHGNPGRLEGWMRTQTEPAVPGRLHTVQPQTWRPQPSGFRPGPLHPIDQEIEVQVRAQPSAFPLQAALPVSVTEKLAWEVSATLSAGWTPLGDLTAAPEIRKHRPLYAAPQTPLPVPRVPRAVTGDLNALTASLPLAGLEIREDGHLRNWTAASRNPSPTSQHPLTVPYSPLMRQRFRGWQGTPKSYEWRVRDQKLAGRPELPNSLRREESPVMIPYGTPVRPVRLELAQGPMPRGARPVDTPLTALKRHAAGFARCSVVVPEIPD